MLRAQALVCGHGRIVAEFFDTARSRTIPWARRPEAAALLAALADPDRDLDTVVIGSSERAATLAEYGLHTVGNVVDVPQHTLQRLFGARAGRALHKHAHGRDTSIVDSTPAPQASARSTALSATSSTQPPTGGSCSPLPMTSVPVSAPPARSPRA
ncbi:hypothetical protein ACWCQS_21610 [Streptomyces sp. NPDC002076]